MTKKQNNKKEMFDSTNMFLDANAPVWSAIPIVSNYKAKLVELITGIEKHAQDQEDAKVYIGESNRQMKMRLATKIDILDDALEAYAEDQGNAELLSQANNTKSDYFRLPKQQFVTKAETTLNLLSEHVEDMADYGLSVDQVDEVKLSLGNYQEKQGIPRSYQIASKTATLNLEDTFAEADKILSRLDKVLKRFKRSDPSFYNGYLSARTIIDN